MEKMWAVLLHFGELWGEKSYEHIGIDRFRLDRDIWNKAIDKCRRVCYYYHIFIRKGDKKCKKSNLYSKTRIRKQRPRV